MGRSATKKKPLLFQLQILIFVNKMIHSITFCTRLAFCLVYNIQTHGLNEIMEEIFCSLVLMKTGNMTCAATNSVPLSTSAIYMDTSAVNGSIPASSYIPFCNPNGRDVLYYELCSSVCLLSLCLLMVHIDGQFTLFSSCE